MKTLKAGAHIHLMGICGTAMASLAALLKERGFKITGSDQNVYPPMSTFLQDRGIEILQGYNRENLDTKPDYVVVGNVISRHFEEAIALFESGIAYGSLPETIRDRVIENRHSLVVCGTHGKTTTTAMASWVAHQADLQPGFLIGGISKNFDTSFCNPRGDWFIIEGDEYDTAFFAKVPKFTFYKPQTAILSGIEYDHADIYPDIDSILSAFASLLELLPKDGLLVHSGEDENIASLLDRFRGKKISYGFNNGDWQARDLQLLRNGIQFNVYYKERFENELFVPMFGDYNALNALAVYAVGKAHGWPVDFKQSFKSFKGVRRRQELIGEPRGIQVIEDFAHHPTAVSHTLQSLKKREGTKKLIAIFEPRSATSRRNYFQEAYSKALSYGDSVYICRPYDAQKLGEEAMDVDQIVVDLKAQGLRCQAFEHVESILDGIANESSQGDTIVIMSNGGFQGIYQKLLSRLNSGAEK